MSANENTIKLLQDRLVQNADLIQILREENSRLEQSSNDLVRELQNALFLSKSLNEECESLREQNQLLTGLASAGGGRGLTEELENAIQEKNRTINYLETTVQQSKSAYELSQQNSKLLEEKIQDKLFDIRVLSDEVAMMNEIVNSVNDEKEGFLNKIQEYRVKTKHLTQQVTSLQGNIRVFCRIKASLGITTPGNRGDYEEEDDDNNPEKVEPKYTYDIENLKYKRQIFSYDRVFEPFVSQQEVFEELEGMVRSSFYGFHNCIISYGGADTGKSYTMFGSKGSNENAGVIWRTFNNMFQAAKLDDSNIDTLISLSFIEIWNEEIYDLLGHGKPAITVRDTIKYDKASIYERTKTAKKSLDLRTYKHHCVVEDLTEWSVDHIEEIESLIEAGLRQRHVIGDRLCKAHLMLVAKMKRKDKRSGVEYTGSVRFVDLASSDKLVTATPGMSSIDLKESQHVNRGLASLSEIMSALSSQMKFTQNTIPYRMSKLTSLLQDSVREHRQVAIIIHVSPDTETDENVSNTLNFGIKCKGVQLRRPDRSDPV